MKTQLLRIFMGALFITVIMTIAMATPAIAHGFRFHNPHGAPACTSRVMACVLPSEDEDMLAAQHCVDGLGTPVSCTSPGPFAYARMDPDSYLDFIQQQYDDNFVSTLDQNPLSNAACVNGMAGPEGQQYPCANVDLLTYMPHDAIGGTEGNDIWGWTDPETGKEYALVGLRDGTSFVDVSEPTTPLYLGKLPTHDPDFTSNWRDIKVYQNHAFIVADNIGQHGIQVFDLTQLRGVTSPTAFSESVHYDRVGSSHNIAINEESGYAYAVGSGRFGANENNPCREGLHIIDIQTPSQPTYAGCFNEDGYTHDVQCVRYRGPDLLYNDREICFGANEDTLTIADTTDKSNPVQLSRQGYPNFGYVHQGWLTEDHRYFLVDDENDERNFDHNSRTYIWDVSDLKNPQLIGDYTAAVEASDHNLYIVGNYVYEANYGSGLRILNLSDIANANLSEVAFFDTNPDRDNAGFYGAWSAYPFFESGTVVVNTIRDGFFVLQPNLPAEVTLNNTDSLLNICAEESHTASLNLRTRNGYTGMVNLTAQNLPVGVSATLTPTVVNVAGDSTTQIDLALNFAEVTPGLYSFDVEAASSSLGRDAVAPLQDGETLRFYWHNSQPTLPTLVSPIDSETTNRAVNRLTWTPSAQISRYTIEIATDDTFTDIVELALTTEEKYTVTKLLNFDQIYSWRVRAHNACGDSAFSASGQFRFGQRFFFPLIQNVSN